MNIYVQYQGFQPSDFTKVYLNSKLNELQERAPYGSTIKATFVREKQNIKAHLRIMSAAGEFFAIAQGKRLRQVNRKLLNQIHKQLQRWKTRRHEGSQDDIIVA